MGISFFSGIVTETWSVISSMFSIFTETSLGLLPVCLLVVTALSFIFSLLGGR